MLGDHVRAEFLRRQFVRERTGSFLRVRHADERLVVDGARAASGPPGLIVKTEEASNQIGPCLIADQGANAGVERFVQQRGRNFAIRAQIGRNEMNNAVGVGHVSVGVGIRDRLDDDLPASMRRLIGPASAV